jgi:hypothetical protein
VAQADQDGVLHAELDRVGVEDRAVLPVPAQIAVAAAFLVPILHAGPGGQGEFDLIG